MEYEKLKQQKEALYADYGKLKKQVKGYGVIKQNIAELVRAMSELSEAEKILKETAKQDYYLR